MSFPAPSPACAFRLPPTGADIVSQRHGPWLDWYWLDSKRNCLVYISTQPA